MIKLITSTLLLASMAQAAPVVKSETNTLEIAAQNADIEIRLPKTAFDVLNKWNPEFTVFSKKDYSKSILDMFKDLGNNQLPMAFIDDVDGNNKKDIVLLGTDLKNQYAIVILQKEKQWTLVKIAQWSMKNIKDTVIPQVDMTSTTAKASGTATVVQETGVPLYVVPAQGEQGEKLKEKKKVGIQVEMYLGPGDVYEIKNNKPVKFVL